MRSSSGYQSPSPVDKLPVNLAPDTVNDRYREVLVVPQTAVTNMPRKLPAMLNRFGIGHELKAHAITWTNAIFHVEEKFLHYQVLVTAGVLRPSALGCTFSRLGNRCRTNHRNRCSFHFQISSSPALGRAFLMLPALIIWRQCIGLNVRIWSGPTRKQPIGTFRTYRANVVHA